MPGGAQDQAVRTGRIARTFIYVVLIYFALFYLLPLFIMAINSLKPLSEITGGNMMSLPVDPTLAPWASAWSTAQIGVEATGLKPYFMNSILMVVPAVAREPIPLTFIRAPKIVRVGDGVRVLLQLDDYVAAAEDDQILVTVFHPELTPSLAFHRYFARKCGFDLGKTGVASVDPDWTPQSWMHFSHHV